MLVNAEHKSSISRMISKNKPLKKCSFCNKELNDLGLHIARQHPNILSQLDEFNLNIPVIPPANSPMATPIHAVADTAGATGMTGNFPDVAVMIRQKLDLMLNIKIIEMLSKSSDTGLKEIAEAINPPRETTLDEIKKYHDIFYKDNTPIETGNEWVNVAANALPLVKDLIASRRQLQQQGGIPDATNVSEGDRGRAQILKPIQFETTGDTGEPSGIGKESGAISDTKQQNN